MPGPRVTIGALLCAVLLAGCGAYAKRDFIARADAICASTVRATRLIAPPGFSRTPARRLAALARYLAGVLPLVEAEANELRTLPRPTQSSRDRASLAGFLTAFGEVVTDYQALAAAAAAGDAPGVARAEAALTSRPVASRASGYGLHSCGAAGATSA